MASLVKSLRRSDRKPVYTFDDSSDEENFVQEMNQTTEQVEERKQTEPVNPLAKIEQILEFEMRPTASVDPIPHNGEPVNPVFVNHYLVKWKGLSYLHCSWVPEEEFQKSYKFNPRLKTRVNKIHHKMEIEKKAEEDFVAIRPEWTTIDRIISYREEGDVKEYLVKYKELPYDETYWEVESDISAFQNEIHRFKDINSGTRRDRYVENERNENEFIQFDQTPDYLTGSLHPYQLEGLNFLRFSWSQETNVILADEMGLGKTIQSIAFLASLFNENIVPHLVVAPLSTLRNWEREFATWTPQLNVVMYTGNYKAREVIREHEFYFPEENKIKFDVLLTSYEIINIDTPVLKTVKWNSMIVDEGHRLKNKDSKLFTSLKQFMSQHRVLLTGTPLQNNLDELFVLMHFLDAGKFGRLETFQKEFRDINQEEQISKLHKMLAPHMLRRVKKDVLKEILPPKKELILRVDLSSHQKALYKAIITRNYQILTKRAGGQISNIIMELRKVCSHPYLVEGDQPNVENADEALKQLVEASGKLKLLDKMMVKLKEQGHRVLIYCQFRRMLDILEDYCSSKNWSYERIDGLVSGAERQVRIDRFNEENSNRFCFLLSTRAGGVGINLATADTVIIYDSDWNPHADIQAMARAHRLGQTNKVMIYRLINRSTVEERMMKITKKKMVLEHLVVGKLKTQNLSQEDLDDIVKYGSKELFSEENEEASKSGKIHYDDASIEKLLDRDQVDAEVSEDDAEDNEFFKAFKVANFECIDENEATTSEQPQATDNKPSVSVSDRKNYWKDLLKDSHEVQQSEELNALGKRKRSCKQLISMKEEDPQMSSEDEDEAEPSAVQETGHRSYPKGVKRSRKRPHQDNSEPKPLIEGEGESLKLLGFNQNERNKFRLTAMRYGIRNSEWKEFIPALKYKTYEEIKAYGVLFMKHLLEASNNTSPTYEDGVPKEGLNRSEVLIRIAEILLFHDKCKYFEDHPTSPQFPEPIIEKFRLNSGRFWKEEHDKLLIRSVTKNGFAKWNVILVDKEFDIEGIVMKEVNFTSSGLGESSSNQTTSTDASADRFLRRCRDFVAKRVHLLKDAINYEHSEEYKERCRLVSVRAGQAETETHAIDTAAEMPMRQRIDMFFSNMFRNEYEAGVEKRGRDKVAELYNQMCSNVNLGESSVQASLSSQDMSPMVREDFYNEMCPNETQGESSVQASLSSQPMVEKNNSPLERSTKEISGTLKMIYDVDRKAYVPRPSSSKRAQRTR